MGGKTKQSQRTKNNARPSSSGRSAELLSNVKLEPGVVSIAGAQLPALFPSLAAPTVDPHISAELQLCLKKLNKKDPITKNKALQELTELVATSSVDDVVSALPSWCHFYKLLSTDPDRKVREHTQVCHGAMVSACGRRLAPQLKQLLPTWLHALHDEHAPAAAHAQRALTKTFPDSKLPEVVSFCKEEILDHVLDVLVGSGEAAHLRKCSSEEERALCAARLSCGALQLVRYCARRVPPPHAAWLWARLDTLLRAPAFWHGATHADDTTRAAWYSCVGGVCARFGRELGAAAGARVLRVLLTARALPALPAARRWDCLLLFMQHVPDWHQYLENKELLGKRIFEVLESGGWGDAKHLCNSLVPILTALPDDMLTKEFYVAFFDALFCGLQKKAVMRSRSEREHWVSGLAECLRHVSASGAPHAAPLVSAAHRRWLEAALARPAPGPPPLARHSAACMARLLRHWLRRARQGDAGVEPLVRSHWLNLGSTLAAHVAALPLERDAIAPVVDSHILLLRTLRAAFAQDPRAHRNITFEDDGAPHDAAPPAEVEAGAEAEAVSAAERARYEHSLAELARDVCGWYFQFARDKQVSESVLAPLAALLADWDSAEVLAGVAGALGCRSLPRLYHDVLRAWLAGDTMRCRALADIVFLIMKHLTEDEQDAVFDTFQQFPPRVVEWCISLSLSHPYSGAAAARRWLRGGVVAGAVRGVCARLLARADHAAHADTSLLLMCLTAHADGESVVSSDAVENALQQVSCALQEVDSPALEARCLLAAQLAATLPPHVELLTALLDLTITLQRGDGRVSAAAWCELASAWQDGAGALPAAPRARLLLAAARRLHHHSKLAITSSSNPDDATIQSKDRSCSLDMAKLEHVVSLCPLLLRRDGVEGVREVLDFAGTLLHAPPEPRHVRHAAARHLILTGDLNCPFEDNEMTKAIIDDKVPELSREDVVRYAHAALLRALFVRAASRPQQRAMLHHLLLALHDRAVLAPLADSYAFWPHYELIEQSHSRLETLLDDIIKEMDADSRAEVARALGNRSNDEGYFWAYARCYFEDKIKIYKVNSENDESCGRIDKTSGESESTGSARDGLGDGSELEGEVRPDSPVAADSSYGAEMCPAPESGESIENKDVGENTTAAPESGESIQNKDVGDDTTPAPESGDNIQNKDGNEDLEKTSEDESSLMVGNLEDVIAGPALLHTLHYLQAKAQRSSSEGARLRAAWLAALAALLAAHAADAPVLATLRRELALAAPLSTDPILNTYYAHNHVMLYERDIVSATWQQVLSNASVCRVLARADGWTCAPQHWDFTNITLCELLSSLRRDTNRWTDLKVAVLMRAVLQLFCSVARFAAGVAARSQRSQPAAHVAALPREWDEIYEPDLSGNLLAIMLHVLETAEGAALGSSGAGVLDALVASCALVRWRRARLDLPRAVRVCCAALARPAHAALKLLAHSLLAALLEPLVLADAAALAAWDRGAAEEGAAEEGAAEEGAAEEGAGGAESPLQLSLLHYDDAFFQLQELVETALAHVKVCEEVCELVAGSDAHSLALGWLLLADLLHRQCALARGDLHHHYLQVYREHKYGAPLLTAALRLLPAGVLAAAAQHEQAAPGTQHAAARYAHMFTAPPPLAVYAPCGAHAVQHAACRALWWCVCGAGAAAARGWRGAARPSHALILDNITARYITPHVVREEFALLQSKGADIEDAEVCVNAGAYVVTCALRVETRAIELQLALSRRHPLALPALHADHAAAGNLNWILMYLGYQNGRILQALRMWCASVNVKLERAPQCYICYCRLHHATGRLPAAHCHTCRNKFHNVCLRKWFLTSGKMTCPLCRANF